MDVAVDPVDGTTLTAKSLPDALAVLALSERGTMFDPGPCVYMEKLAVARDVAHVVDFADPIGDNVRRVAAARGKPTSDVTVAILDRPRHQDLVAAVLETGARIKFMLDGDVAGAIMAADEDSSVDVMVGIGGTPEGVIAACALKCLDGALFGKLYPRDDTRARGGDRGRLRPRPRARHRRPRVGRRLLLRRHGRDERRAAARRALPAGARAHPVALHALALRRRADHRRAPPPGPLEPDPGAEGVGARRRMATVPSLQAEVLVIGGGATGAGVAWDCALRGYDVTLVERGDLAEGTSGRFHGLLHSGGRYVVKDAVAAEECVVENEILRRMVPDCIEDTGGLFVTTPDDDPAYGDRFMEGCRAAKLPAEEIDVGEALRREPRLNPGIRRAFTVPDASIDAWKTVWAFAGGAAERGARILTYHRVIDLHRFDGAVTGARLRNELTGEELDIEAGFVLNASGAWAAQILHMAGIEDVGVVPGKGIMIAMNHRLVNTVINRCTMPADGDILVPIRTVSVIGTTDIHATDPDEIPVTQAEVDQMLDDGERLVPGFRQARALRVWAGVRPLFQDARAGEVKDTRDVSRTHAVVDHRARDGLDGLLTMSGGKLTTLRLMAQDLVDAMCEQLGDDRPCTTADVRPPGQGDKEPYALGSRLEAREETLQDEQLICECELIGRSKLEEGMRAARDDEPRRPPAAAAARHGTVPGRLLHLPGDRDPARRRPARRRRGGGVAPRPSCRSAGRACTRSSTATSCARRAWTTGSSRGCSTSSTCRWRRPHEPSRRRSSSAPAWPASAPPCGSPSPARACSCWPRASARRT